MAAKTVAGVNIRVGATTREMQTQMQKAAGHVRGFGGQMDETRVRAQQFQAGLRSLALRVTGLIAGFIGLRAALRGMFSAMQQALDLDDTAKRLSLNVEQLQLWRGVAEEAGVAAGTLDKAMARMTRRIERAALGTGPAVRALNDLGLSAERLAEVDTDTRLRVIMEAAREFREETGKAADMQALFGTQLDEIRPILEMTQTELRATTELLKEQGRIVEAEQVNRLAEAQREWERMRTQMRTAAMEMGSVVAPAIIRVANAVRDAANSFRAADKQTLALSASLIAAGLIIPRIVRAVMAIRAAIQAMAAAKIASLAFLGPKGWAVIASGAAVAAGAIMGLNEMLRATGDTAKESLGEAEDMVGGLLDQFRDARDAASEVGTSLGDMARDWAAVADRIRKEVATPMESFIDRLDELKEAVILGGLEWEFYERAVERAKDQLLEATEAAEALSGAQAGGAAGAARRGTMEGFRQVQAARREQQKQVRLAEQAARRDERRNGLLQRIEQKIEQRRPVREVIF